MNAFASRFVGCLSLAAASLTAIASSLPAEPVPIGTAPQFFVDDYLVDNRWALRQRREAVLHVAHQPKKHPKNPLIAGEGGFVQVAREPDTGLFKMWYQTHAWTKAGDEESADYAIAYAESKDGLHWTRPKLGIHTWNGTRDNNIVWRGFGDSRASGAQMLQLPERDKRGFRYVMQYRAAGARRGNNGIRLVGSQDGIHWDRASDTLICELPSDTLNSVVHDPARGEYVMYCRAKHLYRLFQGDLADTGESRRIARLANKELWAKWEPRPQNILLPDALDAPENFNAFYGMPARVHAGIYWGALWVFRFNDSIYTELVTSRDGIDFRRAPGRAKMIELGPDGSWDDGMNFGSTDWIEVGDEWWIYYSGWDGDHGGKERNAGVGLVMLPRERFISLRGPPGGGVVVTRQILWPGGKLLVNADASKGELKVRVSGDGRKPLEGFDHADCVPFSGDGVAHEVTWNGKSISALKGQPIRLEFLLRNADLFTFRATGE